jgi:hypothetical protein
MNQMESQGRARMENASRSPVGLHLAPSLGVIQHRKKRNGSQEKNKTAMKAPICRVIVGIDKRLLFVYYSQSMTEA